jgi:hypothetical protein
MERNSALVGWGEPDGESWNSALGGGCDADGERQAID